jgi:hypothetical protein
MTTFLTKKEHILIDNYSMSESLCKKIIEKFELDIKNDNKILNHELDEIQEKVIDKTYDKIYLFLMNELNKNIIKYVNFFNIDKFFNIKRIYDLKDNVIIKKHVNNTDKSNNADKPNSVEIKHKSYLDDDKNRKLFSFIWILNDYDGEIIFCNEYTIKPEKGMFLLFPNSWCFPHSEILKLNQTQFVIYGSI